MLNSLFIRKTLTFSQGSIASLYEMFDYGLITGQMATYGARWMKMTSFTSFDGVAEMTDL